METKIKLATGTLIAIAAFLFSLNSLDIYSVSILEFDEIDALACGEAGCTRDYSKVKIEELLNGDVLADCSGCGSIKCKVVK